MNRTDWIPSTVLAACVLHNICLDSNDMQIENYINAELNEVHGNDEMGMLLMNTKTMKEEIEEMNYADNYFCITIMSFRINNFI
jgi:hypothetical protein